MFKKVILGLLILGSLGVAILVAIAWPRFQDKARIAEAKGTLASFHTSQRAFYKEWKQYHANFDDIGFSPDGELLYAFATDKKCWEKSKPQNYTYNSGKKVYYTIPTQWPAQVTDAVLDYLDLEECPDYFPKDGFRVHAIRYDEEKSNLNENIVQFEVRTYTHSKQENGFTDAILYWDTKEKKLLTNP